MRFSPDKDNTAYTIRAYQARRITVISPAFSTEDANPGANEIQLTRSFVIAPKRLVENWPPQSLPELTLQHLQTIVDLDPELVILGTGSVIDFPAPALTEMLLTKGTESLYTKGIGVEIMDTAAACRTYNVLMHEGRHVVAALIID